MGIPDSLEKALEALAEIEKSIEGIAEVYLYQPEAMAVFPCIINYPIRGLDIREEASTIRSLYTLGAEIHVTRQILAQSEQACRPLVLRFVDAVWCEPTLRDTVTKVNEVRHVLTPILFAGEVHAGIRFEIDVKMRRAVNI